jgi:hypothetical protein
MSIESVPSQKTQANSKYAQRINRVIDYLRGNLDRQVKLDELAKANSTPQLACLPLASILRKLMLRRNVQRVFQSYIASRISKAACWP